MPKRSAHSFTGDAASCCPRPRGRSGCVTTAATSCPAATICSKVGTAKAGMPRKTRRMAPPLIPISGALLLLDLALHQVAFERADVRDVQLAVEMIGFMLQRARQQIFTGLLELHAFGVLRLN